MALRQVKKSIKLILALLLSWFCIHTILIVIDGLTDDNVRTDVGVIFGNKVNVDGSLSERLEKRLDKGIEMYNDSLIKLIVVSGALGREGHYEGTKMSEYLLAKGIPSDKIIIDDFGTTTEATAMNFKKMNLRAKSITVITQYHHVSRAKLAFKKIGYHEVYSGHADYFELRDFYSVVREFFGYYKYRMN
jgi:vancomycin permeability regulator SanA